MDGAKIQLSEDEKRLISSGDWILTKNAILSKANRLLTVVMEQQSDWLAAHAAMFPGNLLTGSPKISRGENYVGLPWLMLDHPRLFSRQDTLAVRTFFWWGNFFSITLQLAGNSLQRHRLQCEAAWPLLRQHNYFIGIADDPWIHHAGSDNYISLNDWSERQYRDHIHTHGFIKLMRTVPLNQWDKATQKLVGEFKFLMGLVAA